MVIIQLLLIVLNLSQQELANKLGVSRQTVSMWNSGYVISKKHLQNINKTFGISMHYLEKSIITSYHFSDDEIDEIKSEIINHIQNQKYDNLNRNIGINSLSKILFLLMNGYICNLYMNKEFIQFLQKLENTTVSNIYFDSYYRFDTYQINKIFEKPIFQSETRAKPTQLLFIFSGKDINIEEVNLKIQELSFSTIISTCIIDNNKKEILLIEI